MRGVCQGCIRVVVVLGTVFASNETWCLLMLVTCFVLSQCPSHLDSFFDLTRFLPENLLN